MNEHPLTTDSLPTTTPKPYHPTLTPKSGPVEESNSYFIGIDEVYNVIFILGSAHHDSNLQSPLFNQPIYARFWGIPQ